MKNRVAIMEDYEKMVIREFDIKEPERNQIVVKIQNCNICTADWQVWNRNREGQNRVFPWAPGHEAAGIVYKLGPGVKEFEIGEHVGIGYTGCGYCEACRTGNSKSCPNGSGIGIDGMDGGAGMSQFLTIDLHHAFRMNKDLPFEEASFLEPLATAVHGLRKMRTNPMETMLIIGAGNLGLVNAQLARAYGLKVLVSELEEERIQLANSMGFETVNPMDDDFIDRINDFTNNRGMDNVIICVGNTKATDQAFDCVKRSGRVLFFAAGYPSPELNLNVNDVHYGNYELYGTGGASAGDYEESKELLSNGTIKVDKLISHQVAFEDVQEAFALASTPGNFRVALKMWGE